MLTTPTQNHPTISIITVVFNGAKTLRATIESIIPHLGAQVEYILIDGGSTDGTQDIIAEYTEHLAYWISEPDCGIYDAMNKGRNHARGDFCIFIGADDEIMPSSIKYAINSMTNLDCVYYGQVLKDEKPFGSRTNKIKLLRNNIPHQAIFYPRSVYKNYSYNIQYKICSDHEYNIRLIHNNIKFHFMNLVVCKFGTLGVSSSCIDHDFARDYLGIVKANAGVGVFMVLGILKMIKRRLLNNKIFKAKAN